MSPPPDLWRAARNNALWCDSVLRALGRPGDFGATLWFSAAAVPRFYPRAVTLAPKLDAAALAQLADLRSGDAVKDSFASLPLEGFETLFDATWYWRPPARGDAARIAKATDLAAWVEAWGGGPGVFAPPLLHDPSVALLRWPAEGSPRSGCAVNRGAGLVGLSNLFGEAPAARSAAIEAAAAFAGDEALICYEADGEAADLLAAGFQPLGPLRVLLRL